MEVVRERITQVPIIDFETPPHQIEKYKFGGQVNRNNFTPFLIDTYAKSRGNTSLHAYQISWIKRQTGVDIAGILTNFLEIGGINCLTPDEITLLQDAYSRVKQHINIREMQIKYERSFQFNISETLEAVLKICQNSGKTVQWSKNVRVVISNMSESVLSLDKENFMEWIMNDGQIINLVDLI